MISQYLFILAKYKTTNSFLEGASNIGFQRNTGTLFYGDFVYFIIIIIFVQQIV